MITDPEKLLAVVSPPEAPPKESAPCEEPPPAAEAKAPPEPRVSVVLRKDEAVVRASAAGVVIRRARTG